MDKQLFDFLKPELGKENFILEKVMDRVMIQHDSDDLKGYYFSCTANDFGIPYVMRYIKDESWYEKIGRYYDTDKASHIILSHTTLCVVLTKLIRRYKIQQSLYGE
jgi:hypothetical protein